MEELNQWKSDFENFIESTAKPNKDVYHYTDKEGLKGILTKKALWLTNYIHLNDSSEILYGLDYVRSYVSKGLPKCRFSKKLFSNAKQILEKNANVFVTSFCCESDYLPAWQTYAVDGKGFSVGFKSSFFIGATSKTGDQPDFGRSKVIYLCGEEKDKLDEKLLKPLVNIIKLIKKESHPRKRERYQAEIFSNIMLALYVIKHPAYKGELEHRIYSFAGKNDANQNFYVPDSSKYRRYFSFETNCISEIWVGPQENFEQAENNILKILDENNYDRDAIKILPSTIPYKNNYQLSWG